MKTGKNFLLLISLALSVLLLTACSGGSSSSSSSTTPAVTPEPVVTDPPATLTILAGDTKIRLNWDAVSSSTYKIYQSTQTFGTITELSQLAGKFLKTADTNSATIEGLSNGTEYHFVVTAVKEGTESLPSYTVSASPGAAIPSNLQVVDASVNGAIKLTWTGILAATSYNIHQATTPFTTFANQAAADYSALAGYALTTTSAATHEFKNLTHGTTYHFLITAVTSGTQSTASNTVFSQPKLSAPTRVSQGHGTGETASFYWDAVTGVSDVEYVIHRAEVPFTGAVEDYSTATLTAYHAYKPNAQVYSVDDGFANSVRELIIGKTYYFVITAVKNGQHSPASTQETYYAIPRKYVRTPVVTAGYQALYVQDFQRDDVTGDTRFHIATQSFAGITDFSSTNLSATLDGYKYFDVGQFEAAPDSNGFTFSNLINGTQYYIVITAFRNNTHSLPTTQVTATPALPVSAKFDSGQVTLSWDTVTSATYKVYYATTTFDGLTVDNLPSNGDVQIEASTTNTHTIMGLTNGTKYYFIVTTVIDGEESIASAELTAIPRLSEITGHVSGVNSVAFSPDGKSILSASGNNTTSTDQTLRIWNSVSGVQTSTLTGHTNWVESVAYSPDGSLIATGGYQELILWNANTGDKVFTSTAHENWMDSITFNSSSTQLASGSRNAQDPTAWIWTVDAANTTLAHTIAGDLAYSSIPTAFKPDGTQLITGDASGKLRLWSTTSGLQIGSDIVIGTGQIKSLAFSPSGEHFIAGIGAKNSIGNDDIVVYNSTSHALVHNLTGHTNKVYSVAFTPDGKHIISGSWDNTIKIWDAVSGGAALETLTGHTGWVNSVDISKDGKRIVSGSADNTIRIWYPERFQD